MIYILIVLLIGYHIYQFYLRNILFYSKPIFSQEENSKIIRSPVCGRVVYSDIVQITQHHQMIKQGRYITCPYQYLKEGEKYLHIGIFMSPFNNHHMVKLNNDQKLMKSEKIVGTLNDMWDSQDSTSLFLGKDWWKDWFVKKVDKWIEYNAREVMIDRDGIVMCIIFDQWVNKLTKFEMIPGVRSIIGFVHRGSQTDLFIPECMIKDISIKPGFKVNFDSKLLELK